MRISVIGGGNMGGAIAFGAIQQGVVTAKEVTISHLSDKMKPLFGDIAKSITLENENIKTISDADYIVIAVKPWLAEEVFGEISPYINRERQRLISVIAGLSFAQMSTLLDFDNLGSIPLYRVIPNTAISIGKGVSIIASHGSSASCDKEVSALFGALGATFSVEEAMMAPLTSLSSCGIAFALRFLDASAKGGVEVGIDPEMSLEVTLKTMEGAITMLQHNQSEPQSEIDKVTTKGGITIKGLEAMEREGFSKAVKCAIKESR